MTKPPKRSEQSITAGIRSVIAMAGYFWKSWQGPMSQPPGVSDIIGVKKTKVSDLVEAGIENIGVFVAIEVKHEGWKPPPTGTKRYRHYLNQETFLRRVRSYGGIGFFAQSEQEAIEKLGIQGRFLFQPKKDLKESNSGG